MLHGRADQYKFTKSYQKLREKGLLDINKLTEEQQELADIQFPDGCGSTDMDRIYIFDNKQIPADRSTTEVDRRTIPTYGLGEEEEVEDE